jgi:hypothetical protein
MTLVRLTFTILTELSRLRLTLATCAFRRPGRVMRGANGRGTQPRVFARGEEGGLSI